jgi:serine/threonine-protein kinase
MHYSLASRGKDITSVVIVSHPRHIQDAISYSLLRQVAQGGMGVVYEAEQKGAEGFAKRVAIKVIREEYTNQEAFRRNFIGEARLVSSLVHTNIVQIYHLGQTVGQCYMVMEWVNGINLESFIEKHVNAGKQVPADWACFIISRICRGLHYAHQQKDVRGRPLGLVHRDVNPRNILLSNQGDIKLTDFGIAKAANLMYNREGEIVAGQDCYLSPEQASKKVTDARSDIFSCGVVLAEMICGYNIFEGDSPEESRENIINMPIPDFRQHRPDLSDEFLAFLNMSLQRDRSLRYADAREMLDAIEWYLYRSGYGPTHEKFAHYLNNLLQSESTPPTTHY